MKRLLGLGLLGLAAAAARAEPGLLVTEPAAGARLTPGDSVWIRWGEIPREAAEQELLLSVDGGRHFRLLTGKLSPGARSYLWTVPELPSAMVLISVRVGEESEEREEEGERVAGRSAVFAISEGLGSSADPDVSGEATAPVPDYWEGPVPLSSGRLGSHLHTRDRPDDCGLCPRALISEHSAVATEARPDPVSSPSAAASRVLDRPPAYPRRQ